MLITNTKNTLHIEDSYKIKSKSEMKEILNDYRFNHPECNVFKRSIDSLISEWKTHNRLYRLGIAKDHTKDVDFEYPISSTLDFCYKILGI